MQKLKSKKLKWVAKRNVFSWHLKVLTESNRRSGDGSWFQARGAATANIVKTEAVYILFRV